MSKDFGILESAIRGKRCSSVPLYEHGIDLPIIEAIMGYDFAKLDRSTEAGHKQVWKSIIRFYDEMGYVYVPVEFGVRFATPFRNAAGTRNWVDEHSGPIQSWDDLENPDFWPDVDRAFAFDTFAEVANLLPAHMKIIGGASGGPFEHASFLMGLENLCITALEDEAFTERLFRQIGETIAGVAAKVAGLEKLGVYRFGDDLGYKTGTMFSPALLRKYVFPWQKKVVEEVHKQGKPFLLHSCGNLETIMDDLIDDVGIDAKHSFEDVIMPVTEAKRRWGERIAILGGIDVDFLCQRSPSEIKDYTWRTLEVCAQNGGYAAGSGNTIASYVPVKNYLAMVEAINEFNRA